jgi:hypothetical protein
LEGRTHGQVTNNWCKRHNAQTDPQLYHWTSVSQNMKISFQNINKSDEDSLRKQPRVSPFLI